MATRGSEGEIEGSFNPEMWRTMLQIIKPLKKVYSEESEYILHPIRYLGIRFIGQEGIKTGRCIFSTIVRVLDRSRIIDIILRTDGAPYSLDAHNFAPFELFEQRNPVKKDPVQMLGIKGS